MRGPSAKLVLAGLVTVCASVWVSAFDLGEIQIHGFVSQGYINTTDNDVFTLDSTAGSFAFNEVGLNFTSEPTDDLRIGVQLFARDLGETGNHEVEIDWAVGEYRWRDYLGLRAGKIKMPFGLYNEIRDADMARSSILLPQGIYSESLRDLINAYLGFELFGNVYLPGGGGFSYRLFGGTVDIDDSYVIRRFMERGAAAGLNSLPIELDQASFAINNVKGSMDELYGMMLEWNTPVDGLRIRGTFNTSESHFSNTTTYSGWMGQIPASITIGTETEYATDHSCVLSAEYRANRLLLAAEYWVARNKIQNELTLLPFPAPSMPERVEEPEAWYLQAGYQLLDWFQLSSYYLEFYGDGNDKDGDLLAMRGEDAHEAWHKELALTARFDLTQNLILKLEGHLVDGTAMVNAIDNPDGTEKDWTMFLARFTFFF